MNEYLMKASVTFQRRGCEMCHATVKLEYSDGKTKETVLDLSGNAISAATWGVKLAVDAVNEMIGAPVARSPEK